MRAKKKLDIFRYLRYNSYINLEKGRKNEKRNATYPTRIRYINRYERGIIWLACYCLIWHNSYINLEKERKMNRDDIQVVLTILSGFVLGTAFGICMVVITVGVV